MTGHPAKHKFQPALTATMMAAAMLVALVLPEIQPAGAAPENDEILVFAASSLAPPLEQIAALYGQKNSVELRFSFASSAALARQIEYGAPADLFITAHSRWLDKLSAKGRIDRTKIRAIAGNRLVLVRSGNHTGSETEGANEIRALLLAPDAGRIATGDPASVPLGLYARDSLVALGLWDRVGPRLAPAAHARAALLQVERGLATLGILFASDAAGSGKVTILAALPTNSYGPINYLAVPVASGSGNNALAGFLEFLTSPEAEQVFLQQGFSPPR